MASSTPKFTVDPASIDYDAAFDALNVAARAAYQVFFFADLTNPSGYPWQVNLKHYGTIYVGFEVVCRLPGKSIKPIFGRNPLVLLPKVQMVHEAIKAGKQPVDARACCPLATLRPCVCVISFNCPVHGDAQCTGSHD